MERRLREFAESTFRLEENEGENKVVSLDEAIRRNVKAGIVLHVSGAAGAALREILRQFWGTKPEFTLFAPPVPLGLDLIHCGLLKKIIFSSVLEEYPTPGISEVFTRAYREKKVDFEVCSLAAMSQRLLAGALGTGFIPTRSMIGTSMAEENKDSFQVIDDPFGSGKRVGIIKAINPDLTIVHGWAADRNGNTILAPRTMIGSTVDDWSALASKNEVVVTVERLVSTAFIREHSSLVKIPGYRVNSVSVVPLGAHPGSMLAYRNIKEFETYGHDIEFSIKHREAARTPEALDTWLKEWVLDCPTNEDYLRKVGHDRIQALKEDSREDMWESQLPSMLEKVSPSIECNEIETMTVIAAREIKERVLKRGHKVVLCGIGTSALAAWLAYYRLKEEGHLVDLMIGGGFFGFAPRPGDPSLTNIPSVQTCKIIADVVWAYNLILIGESRRSISILGAGQIDKLGNINSGRISDKLFVAGPGGSADAFQACETLALVSQSKTRFVERVPYVTVPGEKVKTLVSTLGIFEKLGDDEEFSLTACLPSSKFPTLDEKIEKIKENCGWELRVAPKVEEIPPPTFEELMTLRIIDPDGLFRH